MTIATISPLLQALVQMIRATVAITTVLTGGVHEGSAPDKTEYPFLTYDVHYAPRDRDSTNVTTRIGVDLLVHDRDQVRARNLAQALSDLLIGAQFSVSGQSTLYSDIDQELYSTDHDGEGQKVYLVGALYEIWMDQARSA